VCGVGWGGGGEAGVEGGVKGGRRGGRSGQSARATAHLKGSDVLVEQGQRSLLLHIVQLHCFTWVVATGPSLRCAPSP
jgi:hypothetical protein